MHSLFSVNTINDEEKISSKRTYTSDIDGITICGIYVKAIQKIAQNIGASKALADSLYSAHKKRTNAKKKGFIGEEEMKLSERFMKIAESVLPIVSDLANSLLYVGLDDDDLFSIKRIREGAILLKNNADMFFMTYNSRYADQLMKISEVMCAEFDIMIKYAKDKRSERSE